MNNNSMINICLSIFTTKAVWRVNGVAKGANGKICEALNINQKKKGCLIGSSYAI